VYNTRELVRLVFWNRGRVHIFHVDVRCPGQTAEGGGSENSQSRDLSRAKPASAIGYFACRRAGDVTRKQVPADRGRCAVSPQCDTLGMLLFRGGGVATVRGKVKEGGCSCGLLCPQCSIVATLFSSD